MYLSSAGNGNKSGRWTHCMECCSIFVFGAGECTGYSKSKFVDEWKKQKDYYLKNKTTYSIQLAFATFYLNRTNRSGILKAGPIGGYAQKGNYPISARFNKEKLKERVKLIASYKSKIKLYNMEIKDFIRKDTERIALSISTPHISKREKNYILISSILAIIKNCQN